MTKAEREDIRRIYRYRIEHYFSKGLGELSDLSDNTTITPRLVKNCLERFIELGGNDDYFIKKEGYEEFLSEVMTKDEQEEELEEC